MIPRKTDGRFPPLPYLAILPLLVIGFFYLRRSDPPPLVAIQATPIAQQTTATPSPTLSPTPLPTATSVPDPITPTTQPTAVSLPSPTPLPITTPTATPANTATAAPTNAPSNETATTPTAWPTVEQRFFVKPPARFEMPQSHLWFSRPVNGNNNPSPLYRFGMTYNQRLAPHHGIDIANETGTPVWAVGAGTVFYAGEDIETLFGPKADFYGRLVVIEMHTSWEGHTLYTLYGHLETVDVTTGQIVNPGDILGTVGSTGIALGSHLHFEVRQDDPYSYESVRNPELWYWPYAGRGVLAGRVVDSNGRFLPGTRVDLACSDGNPRHVTTYWNPATPPDDLLLENFAISELPAGICLATAELFAETVTASVEIIPNTLQTVLLQATSAPP